MMRDHPCDYDKRAGWELRRLRHRRQLTLQQAAKLIHISISTLSRRERGEDEICHNTIRSTIKAYKLNMEESYGLWSSAGLLPEPELDAPHTPDITTFAPRLLYNQPNPAFITDQLCYLRAWNHALDVIWHPREAPHQPVHIIDDLLSERQQQRLGAEWERCVLRSMRFFYQRTLRIVRDPQVRHLLHTLHERHRETFTRFWEQARNEEYITEQMLLVGPGLSIIPHETPFGVIRYMVTTGAFSVPSGYEFILYAPTDRTSQQRYEQFKEQLNSNRVFFAGLT